jgi:stress-induced-phosphoprotein 1
MQTANIEEDTAKRRVLYAQAAKYYTDAAGSYFEDDEKHAYFLKIALDAHWWSGSPLKITLPLCARIRTAITEMKKIWEFSADASLMEPQYRVVLAFETNFRRQLSEYKATWDDVARPEYAVSCKPDRSSVLSFDEIHVG